VIRRLCLRKGRTTPHPFSPVHGTDENTFSHKGRRKRRAPSASHAQIQEDGKIGSIHIPDAISEALSTPGALVDVEGEHPESG
jgi:hypothetical protein